MSRVPRAELRVHVALDAFPQAEQEWWVSYVAAGRSAAPIREESKSGWVSVDRLVRSLPRGDREAYVLRRYGTVYVCPRRLDLRALLGVLSFRRSLPPVLTESILPAAEAQRAVREVELVRIRDPERRVHVHSAAWWVPPHWFVAFEEGERSYRVDGEGLAGISYEAATADAVGRLTTAASVARDAVGATVGDALHNLGEWLEGFGPESRVVLDYGTVASLFTAEALADDRSARDAQGAVEALSRGDVMRSSFFYAALVERWARARDLEHSS